MLAVNQQSQTSNFARVLGLNLTLGLSLLVSLEILRQLNGNHTRLKLDLHASILEVGRKSERPLKSTNMSLLQPPDHLCLALLRKRSSCLCLFFVG